MGMLDGPLVLDAHPLSLSLPLCQHQPLSWCRAERASVLLLFPVRIIATLEPWTALYHAYLCTLAKSRGFIIIRMDGHSVVCSERVMMICVRARLK